MLGKTESGFEKMNASLKERAEALAPIHAEGAPPPAATARELTFPDRPERWQVSNRPKTSGEILRTWGQPLPTWRRRRRVG